MVSIKRFRLRGDDAASLAALDGSLLVLLRLHTEDYLLPASDGARGPARPASRGGSAHCHGKMLP
ncbi:MAG TPA: hypothetical protein VMT52_13735 [Planctomycetota bacterium]|nr:hypothetical protein [Planctomycetota bacterium]